MPTRVYQVTEQHFRSTCEPDETFEEGALSQTRRAASRRECFKGTVLVLREAAIKQHLVATQSAASSTPPMDGSRSDGVG